MSENKNLTNYKSTLNKTNHTLKDYRFETMKRQNELYELAKNFPNDFQQVNKAFEDQKGIERIKKASLRYLKTKESIERIIKSGDYIDSNKISLMFSEVYKINSSIFNKFLQDTYYKNHTYEYELLGAIMFFSDINSQEELEIKTSDIKDVDFLNNEATKFGELLIDINSIEMNEAQSAGTTNSTELDFSAISNSEYSSPFKTIYGSGTETISPENGSLILSQPDFTLPGRSGLDFNFTRIFNSSYAVISSANRYKDPYDLGLGWSLDLPKYHERHIYFGSRGSFKVKTADSYEADIGNVVNLSGAEFEIFGTIFVTTSSKLRLSDGTIYLFNGNGNIDIIENKFGEKIFFSYSNDEKIAMIIDSVGRKIGFTHSDNLVTVNVYESKSSSQPLFTWRYEKENIESSSKQKLTKVIPPEEGMPTFYSYSLHKGLSGYYGIDTVISNIFPPGLFDTLNLESVIKASGAEDLYEYEHYVKATAGRDGATIFPLGSPAVDSYRITRRYTMVPSVEVDSLDKQIVLNKINDLTFSYSTFFADNYAISKYATLKKTYDEDGIEQAEEYWEFDTRYRNTLYSFEGKQSLTDRSKIEKATTYGDDKTKYPSIVVTTISCDEISKTYQEEYIWDGHGNMIRCIDSRGKILEYAYHPTYNMLTEENEMVNEGNEIKGKRTVYTLDETKRNTLSKRTEMFINNINHNLPIVTIKDSPNSYTWRSQKKLRSVYLTLRWSTGGWGSTSKYRVEYRKTGDTNWILYYESPLRDGNLISTIHTTNVAISFPEIGFYEIRIVNNVHGNNYVIIDEGSYAYESSYLLNDLNSFVYEEYSYHITYPGNLAEKKIYPLGLITNEPDSRTTYIYDTLWNAYPMEVATQVTNANEIMDTTTVKKVTQYDKLGRVVLSRFEENGVNLSESKFNYDDLGRIIEITNPSHDHSNETSTKTIAYYDSIRQSEITDELGHIKRETYDGLGKINYIEWKDNNGDWHLERYFEYDFLGREASVFDAAFNETRFEYDSFNRNIKTIFADGSILENWYASVNLPINSILPIQLPSFLPETSSWKKTQDAENNISYIGYDILGRTIWSATNPKINPPLGIPIWDITWNEYDGFGRITKAAINRTSDDWDITEYEYEYNGSYTIFDLPLTMKLPGDIEPKYIYEYNSRGLKTREYQVNQPSQDTKIEYDELSRVKQIIYPTKSECINPSLTSFVPCESNVAHKDKFYYNVFGIIRGETFANNNLESTVEIEYNKRGWETKKSWQVDGSTYSFNTIYDAYGNITTMIYPDNKSVSYIYDELNRIKSIPNFFANGSQPGFVYDNIGNITDIFAVNGLQTHYTYNNLNRITSMSSTPLSLNYDYDRTGNIISITDSSNGRTPVTLNYTYDAKGQLKTADINVDDEIEKISFLYDGAGNRIREIWNGDINEYMPYEYLNKLGKSIDETLLEKETTSSRGYTYSYLPGSYLKSQTGSTKSNYNWDSSGQLLSKSTGENYIFSGKKNLSGVKENGIVKEIYTYDALGNRLKVISSKEMKVNFPLGNDCGYEIKTDLLSGEIITTKYISMEGKYLAKTVEDNQGNEENYFLHIDLVGSMRAITDSNGDLYASYEYEPFGVVTLADSFDNDNISFGGKRLDSTGLSYFGARYYDAEIGRFISRDPILAGRNWFVYCNNNPLTYIDPLGLDPADAYLFKQNNPPPSYKDINAHANWTFTYAMELAKPSLVTFDQLTDMGFKNVSNQMVFDLNLTLKIYDITSPEHISHFLAQCAYETAWGTKLIEKDNAAGTYLKNKSYYPYYGGGYIQFTGKGNYKAFSEAMGDPKILSEGPAYVAANYAWSSAGWWWNNAGMNQKIDSGYTSNNVSSMVTSWKKNALDNGSYKARANNYNNIYDILTK